MIGTQHSAAGFEAEDAERRDQRVRTTTRSPSASASRPMAKRRDVVHSRPETAFLMGHDDHGPPRQPGNVGGSATPRPLPRPSILPACTPHLRACLIWYSLAPSPAWRFEISTRLLSLLALLMLAVPGIARAGHV